MIRITKIDEDVPTPTLQTTGSVGYDVIAHSLVDTSFENDGRIVMVNVGIACQPPPGYFFQLHERSSLHKSGWTLCNSVGVIDSDYCGWIMCALLKIRDDPKPISEIIAEKARICQLVLHRSYTQFDIQLVDDLNPTERGVGGFGSTN